MNLEPVSDDLPPTDLADTDLADTDVTGQTGQTGQTDTNLTAADLTGTDLLHLRRALELAVEAATRGDGPFGAVLVAADGTVLAEGLNGVRSTGDLRAHAELGALEVARSAGFASRAAGGTMYASGEPCPMCAAGMVWADLGTVVFAASAGDIGALLGPPGFDLPCREVVARSTSRMRVRGPVQGIDALGPFETALG